MIRTSMRDGVATLTLSSPPVNAISEKWLTIFDEALDKLSPHKCTVLHIRSNQKVFCAGADLQEVSARITAARSALPGAAMRPLPFTSSSARRSSMGLPRGSLASSNGRFHVEAARRLFSDEGTRQRVQAFLDKSASAQQPIQAKKETEVTP